jgi:undecaprenyl-diphosphatase
MSFRHRNAAQNARTCENIVPRGFQALSARFVLIRLRILSLDQAVILATDRFRSGEFRALEIVLRTVSRAGDGYFWLVMLAVALATGHTKASVVGLLAAAFGLSTSLFLKHFCRRARPEGGANWGRFLAPDKYSFPSGHTATAFSLAAVTATHWPAIAPALWVCAGCIALSRTLLGFHYLSDVIAGAALGLLSGLSAVQILS